jgi:hypothetical protein
VHNREKTKEINKYETQKQRSGQEGAQQKCNFPGQMALPHADSRRETLCSRRHAEGKRQKKNKPVWESTSVKTTGTNFVTCSRTQKRVQ